MSHLPYLYPTTTEISIGPDPAIAIAKYDELHLEAVFRVNKALFDMSEYESLAKDPFYLLITQTTKKPAASSSSGEANQNQN